MTQFHSLKKFFHQALGNRLSNLKSHCQRVRRTLLAIVTLFTVVLTTFAPGKAHAGSEPESTLDESIQAALAQANLVDPAPSCGAFGRCIASAC